MTHLDLPRPPAWTADGLCTQIDHDIFYPHDGGSYRQAKQVCAGCPVAAQCLEYALERHEPWGVWGGLTPIQRRAINRQRAA